MAVNPTSVYGNFMLEPASINNTALGATGTNVISGASSGSVIISTSGSNSLILLFIGIGSGTITSAASTPISDTRGLVWNKLAATTGTNIRGELWWAYEPTPQSHTINVLLSGNGNAAMIASEAQGCQFGTPSMPIDPQGLVSAWGTGNSATTISIYNTNPANYMVSFIASDASVALTLVAGFTSIASTRQGGNVTVGGEYLTTSATGVPSSIPGFTTTGNHDWVVIGASFMATGNYIQLVNAVAGQEFILKNIFTSGSIAFSKWNGIYPEFIGSSSGIAYANLSMQVVNNSLFIAIQNTSAQTVCYAGYDGIRSI